MSGIRVWIYGDSRTRAGCEESRVNKVVRM